MVKVWFTDQNRKPLEVEDKINLTLIIDSIDIIKMRYSLELLLQKEQFKKQQKQLVI